VTRTALKPSKFPWYDYSRYTFSLGLKIGNRILLSGHTASEHDPQSKTMVVKGGMAEQCRTAYAKIAAILGAGGQSLADVVRVVEYVSEAGIERYAEAAQVRGEVFGLNRPAVNTVVVKSLLRPQAFIEIEVTANRNPSTATISAARRDAPPAWVPARAMDGVVYLSSILPHDDFGGVVAPGDVVGQTRAVFERASQVLKSFGLKMENVVKTVDYINPAALPEYKSTGRVRREYLAPVYPAATGIIMPRVSHPGAMIQVDFIASHYPKTIVNPGWSRYAELTYSPAVRAGDALFIAGMAALDPATGNAVHPGDIAAQAAFVYKNILRTVAAAGGGPEHLAKTVEYVTSAALPRYREVAGVRTRLLREPYPPSTGVICETLLRPEFQIEIDSLAILD
jgi:enamine deaminase RidA (YjgF/YER057c/UK114 family)